MTTVKSDRPVPARRGGRRRAVQAEEAIRYIETSALVAALLEGDARARLAIGAPGRRVTSALTLAEAARAVIRARSGGRLSPADERAAVRALAGFERRIDVVAITEAVLERVRRPFPVEPVRTPDAIHLASAGVLSVAPQIVTVITTRASATTPWRLGTRSSKSRRRGPSAVAATRFRSRCRGRRNPGRG